MLFLIEFIHLKAAVFVKKSTAFRRYGSNLKNKTLSIDVKKNTAHMIIENGHITIQST